MTFLPVLPKLTEARFQQQVVELATMLGWRVRHDRATNQRRTCRACSAPLRCAACSTELTIVRNDAGMPDLLLTRRPRLIWAELKSDRGKVTPEQRAFLEELRSCGQEAYVFRPMHLDSAIVKILR